VTWILDVLTEGLHGFAQSLYVSTGIVPYIRPHTDTQTDGADFLIRPLRWAQVP
jgi:hypothetical protein